MNTLNILNPPLLIALLQIAALLHVGLLWAGLSMPKAVSLNSHLAQVPVFIRRLFYVYYGFIGMILIAFGVMTFSYAAPMVAGEPVARGLCLLMAVFWAVRLVAAIFLFDVRPYLRNRFLRLGYFGLNCVFVYLVILYAFVAWRGGLL
jgi:hypothetical protein